MFRIGVAISESQIKAAVFDKNLSIVKRVQYSNSGKKTPKANLTTAIKFINSFLVEKQKYEPCIGIGIGCPGPLDFSAGKVLKPPYLHGWDGFELVAHVEGQTGCKTVLNNDANCAGLAEARLGAGKGKGSVFYINVSTSIGGAFVYKGELVNGAHSSAAEVYNLIVCDDRQSHRGVNAGSLDEVCGVDVLAQRAQEVFERPVTAEELYNELYLKEKDKRAQKIIDAWFNNLAKGIANIACIVDPDIFILGGPIALKSEGFFDTLKERARSYLIHPDFFLAEKSLLGEDSGLIGAALLLPHSA